jgi:hypothetical protein
MTVCKRSDRFTRKKVTQSSRPKCCENLVHRFKNTPPNLTHYVSLVFRIIVLIISFPSFVASGNRGSKYF